MRIGILVSDFLPMEGDFELKNGISLGLGGTELQSLGLARNLSRKHDVTVITRRYKNLPKEEKRKGFSVRRFGFIDFPVISFFSHVISSLMLVRKERPDILQCMMLTPNGLVGVFSGKLFGIRFVPWVRGGDWYLTKGFIGRRIVSYVIRNSPLILVQTESIQREVSEKFPGKRVVAVPNGVEPQKAKANGSKVVYVGNLRGRKGVKYLIEAMKGIGAELVVVGDGPERRNLESLAGENVSFTGRVMPEDVQKYLKEAAVFVLPAIKGEGLPNVVLEAMSMGIPVVSTNIAGIPDVVEHGRTGFLAEPGDPRTLRKHIKRLLEDRKLRENMSRECIKEAEKYSWESVTNKLEKAYEEVLCAE